jgi:hypothetical protein
MSKNRKISFLVLLTLLSGQIGASAFTPYQVENRAKVLLYWGDVEENITTGNDKDFSGSITGKDGRVLALQNIALESSDEVTHKDSRSTGSVEFTSNIEAGIDGLLLLINENETELVVETQELGSQAISMSALQSNDFSFDSGDLGLRAMYLGKDFMSTPENPSSNGKFEDTPTSQWYFKYVQRIKDRKVEKQSIFEGYKTSSGQLTGQFGPGDNITVGEMLKVVLRVSGLNEKTTNLDASLANSTHWSVGFQNRAIDEQLTIMEAVGIDPNRTVSRGEFFQALVEAQGMYSSNNYNCSITDLDFEDLDSSNPYTKYACILIKDGVISGTDDGFLNLFSDINRAEVAKILNTALDIYVEQPRSVQDEINDVENLDESNNSSNNSGGNNSGNSNSPTVSEAIIEQSVPSLANRHYEVKSTNGLSIDNVDNAKITITNETSQGSGVEETSNGTTIDSVTVNNKTILRVKKLNQDWINVDYTILFEEGAITYADGTTNIESTLTFNPNFTVTGPALTWEISEIEYNNNIMAVRLAVDDSAGDLDLTNEPKTAVNIGRKDSVGSVPFKSIEVLEVFGNDNDIIIFLDTDNTFSEAYAGGVYEIIVDGLQYESGLSIPSFEDTFTINSKFVNEGTAISSTLTNDSTPYRINFPNQSSAVRFNDLELTLERVEAVQGGSVDYIDQTNDLATPTINASGQFSILKQFQWSDGNYILTIKDTLFDETEAYNFTVNTN